MSEVQVSSDSLSTILQIAPLKCDKCNVCLTPKTLMNSISDYGVTLLAGESDAFIGWSCPTCKGTRINLANFDVELFFRFLSSVHDAFTESSNILVYRSFPHTPDAYSDNENTKHWLQLLEKNFGVVELPEGLADFESSSKYRSFIFGQPNVGEAILVFWYSRNQIESLIGQENKEGIKKFPRFYSYMPCIEKFYNHLDRYCWNNMLKSFYLQSIKQFIPSSRHIDEYRLIRTHAFINVLQSSYYVQIHDTENDENHNVIYQIEDFNNIVWSVFRTDWMQELLFSLSTDFILNYLPIVKRVDLSIEMVKIFIESYLKKIYEYASSPKERRPVKEVANKAYQRRLEEAEKAFPSVKIVSQDLVISDIKVNISKWVSVSFADRFLILGEAGTGKELFAKAIHEAGGLKGRFIKVDCGSIPLDLFESSIFGHVKGAFTGAVNDKKSPFEEADGGTVYFDEIGNLPQSLQPKLLCAIQDLKYTPIGTSIAKPINSKFIFATNKNLEDMVRKGLFMPDLYGRFNTPQITIPPLRERRDDIEYLVNYFIKLYGSKGGKDYSELNVSQGCLHFLRSLDWPGNVRDVENVIKYVMLNRIGFCDKSEITEFDLPAEIRRKHEISKTDVITEMPQVKSKKRISDEQLVYCLNELNHNKSHVAKKLGITYKTVWLRCQKLGI